MSQREIIELLEKERGVQLTSREIAAKLDISYSSICHNLRGAQCRTVLSATFVKVKNKNVAVYFIE